MEISIWVEQNYVDSNKKTFQLYYLLAVYVSFKKINVCVCKFERGSCYTARLSLELTV